ncbi:arsenate reductase family protein [Robertkochia flava]|uniref:arsenate reductase family protein n=1 Tax=Robertkochia flava TaxID=3447986 RepID=UPI001CCCE9F5|nr:ArsC/Spx/MgsR family protein [Robertkochia marina]
MKKFYYLGTCDTCKRILKELDLPADTEMTDVKKSPLTAGDLEHLYQLSGSYEALLNKRSQLYKQRGLKDQTLTEEAIRDLILEHYTFLKRPVLVVDDKIFIGNAKNTVAEAKACLSK